MITVNGFTKLAGCYVGSSLGFWYGVLEVASLADTHLGTDYHQQAQALGQDDTDSLVSLLDELEAQLNAVTVGGYFIWGYGEFFLVEDGSEHDLYIRGEQ